MSYVPIAERKVYVPEGASLKLLLSERHLVGDAARDSLEARTLRLSLF